MSNPIKNWLSQNEIHVDEIGRVIIEDVRIISEINGAMKLVDPVDNGNIPCGAGCDSGCHACESEAIY